MFYCENCRVEKGWPVSLAKSGGPCELCQSVTLCHDVPKSILLTYATEEGDHNDRR